MPVETNEADARQALDAIALRRRQIIAEIGLPGWYWCAVALGWVAVGAIGDLGHPWLTAAATLLFGTLHAAVAQHVLSGRHRSSNLSVRADLVGWRLPALVIGYLAVLGVATVAIALLVAADGAGHPGTIASIIVALAMLCGGPRLTAVIRRRSAGSAAL